MSEFNIEWSNYHDMWNIIWLPIVFSTNIYLLFNLNIYSEEIFVNVFLLYLVLDMLWLIVKSCSVVNPRLICAHHIVSIIGVILIPYLDYDTKYMICLATLTEINTWIRLIRNKTTGYINFTLDILFIISWIVIRCVIGPMISVKIYYMCNNIVYSTIFVVSVLLNALTAYWTILLFEAVKNKIEKYYKKE